MRSLADDLRARTDDDLATLLLLRPDLARPAPADLTSLAARAVTRASLMRALDDLDTGALQVLEAVAVLAPAGGVAAVGRLLRLPNPTVAPVLDDLWRRALVWRSGHARHVPRPVAEALGPYVAGLAPASVTASFASRTGSFAGSDSAPGSAIGAASGADSGSGSGSAAAVSVLPGPLSALSPGERAVLDRLTWGPPTGRPPREGASAQAVRSLLAAGWLAAFDDNQVVLPRALALELRGGRLHRRSEPNPPPWTPAELPARRIDGAAAGAAAHLLDLLDELLELWGQQPPRVLRSGGLAVRDLRRVSDHLDVDAALAAFLVELARDAGLVGDDGNVEPAWRPTFDADEWATLDPAHRWAALVSAWLASTRAPHRVGSRGADTPPGASGASGASGPVNALSDGASWPRLRLLRREVLAELLTVPPGRSVDADALEARLSWRHPLRPPAWHREVVEATLQGAEWLGVTGAGAVPEAVRALLSAEGVEPAGSPTSDGTADAGVVGSTPDSTPGSSPDSATGSHPDSSTGSATGSSTDSATSAAAAAIAGVAALLPAPVEHALLQADLTAVVPGPPAPSLARLLKAAAHRESRGGASVFRFDGGTVRRALDAGYQADELLAELARVSPTGVPQPLTYLVRDVARRHGTARVGAARSYVRSDDPAALDMLLARREAGPAQLRRLAPTVAISALAPAALVDTLRAAGGAPVLEGIDGVVVSGGPEPARTRRRVPPPVVVALPTPADADRLVRAMRAGQEARDRQDAAARADTDGPTVPAAEPAVVLALVREAIARRSPLWIGVADADGTTRRVLLHPTRVEGGRVQGLVEERSRGSGRGAAVGRPAGETGGGATAGGAPGGGERALSLHRITGATLP
ncbi:hypothetical protein BJY21_000819 [Kineosphaera limosa]|uniref:helicase-associated domain-containing protein n=1 Tax=Kineosphaera limosa TaxID=111564 RepID=UPI0015CE6B6B|nr:hypothetical protein [Kineosphaera limosa]